MYVTQGSHNREQFAHKKGRKMKLLKKKSFWRNTFRKQNIDFRK